jgi:hypothetical protein
VVVMNAGSNALKNLTWLFAVLLPACAVGQIPEGWEIIEIFPAGTEYYCGPPDINDRGQIVFHRRLWPSLTDIEIFLYDRGTLVQLTDDKVYDSFPRINNHGDFVWKRDTDGLGKGSNVVLWRNGELIMITDVSEPEGPPDINDAGQVVWSRNLDLKSDVDEVFLWDGYEVRQLTKDGFSNQGCRINQKGDIVWTQYDFSVSPWLSRIVAYFSGILESLTKHDGTAQRPDLNDLGVVVWHDFVLGTYRLIRWELGKAVPLVYNNAAAGHINNRGEICLNRRNLNNGNGELWFRTAEEHLLRITNGEVGVNFTALNERGEIAFQYGQFPYYGVSLLTKTSFPADLNFDSETDLKDFSELQSCIGVMVESQRGVCTSSDINNDGVVDLSDFLRFAECFAGPE